jgi:hypothetical protein
MSVPSEGWESRWKRHLAQIAASAVREPEQGWRRAMGGRTFDAALNMPLGA